MKMHRKFGDNVSYSFDPKPLFSNVSIVRMDGKIKSDRGEVLLKMRKVFAIIYVQKYINTYTHTLTNKQTHKQTHTQTCIHILTQMLFTNIHT